MPEIKPRERAMPLVPQPFLEGSRSRHPVFRGERPTAASFGKFCPNLDTTQYRESLSEKKKTELDQRAAKLCKRATCNQVYKASEFCWEVSAWKDVFGLLYDDERFLIDKRPYEFLEIDDIGKAVVKKRIPDATIGLKSYDDFLLKRGYFCNVSDCEEDHSAMEPDKRLSDHALRAMMHDPECGLVVDGVWGKTKLLFPFAVYEAKKTAILYRQAEDQIHHACRTYLAMLDDLARNPNNVAEYQTEESSKYQLFAFASCGSYWQVFLVWNTGHDCMMETIWEGYVTEFSRAFDLICIVDQIQDYAANHHRPFVMNHLEAWHARHQKTLEPFKEAIREINTAYSENFPGDSNISGFNSDDSNSSSNDFDELAELFHHGPIKRAEWLRLKARSNNARQEIANETRKRNRRLLEITQAPKSVEEPQKKRPRGRPRKAGPAKKEAQAPKRGRGRPSEMASKIVKTGLKQ